MKRPGSHANWPAHRLTVAEFECLAGKILVPGRGLTFTAAPTKATQRLGKRTGPPMGQRVFAAVLLSVCVFTQAGHAAEGRVHRCTVRDFINTDGTGDAAFIQANKEKIFDIHEFENNLTVVSSSRTFKPSSKEYLVASRGLLQTSAVAEGDMFLDTLTIDASKEEPVQASIILQTPDFVNVWLLTCVVPG